MYRQQQDGPVIGRDNCTLGMVAMDNGGDVGAAELRRLGSLESSPMQRRTWLTMSAFPQSSKSPSYCFSTLGDFGDFAHGVSSRYLQELTAEDGKGVCSVALALLFT
jgi:hypothetical protein